MRPLFEQIAEEDLARWRGMSAVMIHPLVWTHNSGRKSLVIGSHADSVVGRPIPHGRSLLVRLQEWAAQPGFSYHHDWQEGDWSSGTTAAACTASSPTTSIRAAGCIGDHHG